jgi:hypothetical protein
MDEHEARSVKECGSEHCTQLRQGTGSASFNLRIPFRRESQNQPTCWGKIHRLGFSPFGHQFGPEARKKIVQAWRATGWWPDHYSIAIFDITKVEGGSKLFTQIGIPPDRYSGHYRGWIETYWTPMKEIFAMGRISESTRNRVHIDRTERINPQNSKKTVEGSLALLTTQNVVPPPMSPSSHSHLFRACGSHAARPRRAALCAASPLEQFNG